MSHQPIILSDPQSPAAEAYRALRTNLMLTHADNPPRCIVVAPATLADSPNPVAANLAVALAQAERRTLLVDADLRRPRLHDMWGLENTHGLTTLVQTGDAAAIQPGGVENLWVLTSGPKPISPADLLESKKMAATLNALREQYDMVIFETPPIGAVTDAALLASKLDGVLLVMTAGKTRRDQAQQAHELLEKVKSNVLGVVLTNAPDAVRKGY